MNKPARTGKEHRYGLSLTRRPRVLPKSKRRGDEGYISVFEPALR